MNFDFSDDAKTLRDEARRFLTEQAGPGPARKVMDAGASHDDALWRRVVELGWTAARVPEAAGGLGLSHEEACVLAEEAGRSLAPVPLASTLAFTEALVAAGSAEQQARWLPKVASGEAVGCIAWAEGDARSPTMLPGTRLEGGRAMGTKLPVVDGHVATVAVVTVAGDDGPAMALVDLTGEGVTVEAVETLDLVRPAARVTLNGAPAEPLGTAADWRAVLDRLAVLQAFEAIGTANAAMDMTVAYAKDRVAFGQRIGRYQGVKHKLADMYIKLELARAHALHGAASMAEGGAELTQAASAARVASLDALRFAAEEAVQLHGGIGFTWEHDCQLYYRRSRALAASLGTRRYWSERLVRTLERRNRAAA